MKNRKRIEKEKENKGGKGEENKKRGGKTSSRKDGWKTCRRKYGEIEFCNSTRGCKEDRGKGRKKKTKQGREDVIRLILTKNQK